MAKLRVMAGSFQRRPYADDFVFNELLQAPVQRDFRTPRNTLPARPDLALAAQKIFGPVKPYAAIKGNYAYLNR